MRVNIVVGEKIMLLSIYVQEFILNKKTFLKNEQFDGWINILFLEVMYKINDFK